jgi:mannan endo-1,4-beta-mannosidase
MKKIALSAALALAFGAGAFFLHFPAREPAVRRTPPSAFVTADGTRFLAEGRPFRFAGANVSVMYREDDRALAAKTLRRAAEDGAKVVRVWAHGEGGPDSPVRSVGADGRDWPRHHPFRFAPDRWNEEAFRHLDRVVAEAARNGLYVQLCLSNWWRDTGGVTQYLRWAGLPGADDRAPYGIDVERAMAFYSDERTRRMYKDHVERVVLRRNTVTGRLYRDDPTIFAWELMNEAQAPTWRWEERRAWVAEMSAFIRSLDPNHLITPGIWGYRNAIERRLWLEDHRLPHVGFAEFHHYPMDDKDTFVDSPATLGDFLENRAAAAVALGKPVVLGEFGMKPAGHGGHSQSEWYRAVFDHASRLGLGGVMYWILTPDPNRGYGVSHAGWRDGAVLAEIREGARKMEAAAAAEPPPELQNAERYLAPRAFALGRRPGVAVPAPSIIPLKSGKALHRFAPEAAVSGRFERIGAGPGYVWGSGTGFFEYEVPQRKRARRVGAIVVRAALKPVAPWDSRGRIRNGDVTLSINGVDCGTQRIETPPSHEAHVYEWKVDAPVLRAQVSRGERLAIRFSVPPDAERPFGLNISNFPRDARGQAPVEVEF